MQAAVETGAEGTRSIVEVIFPKDEAAVDVEERLRVMGADFEETEVAVRVFVDIVDLSVHTRLLALPEALRGLTAMRKLIVKRDAARVAWRAAWARGTACARRKP